jgi:hypothetical protein
MITKKIIFFLTEGYASQFGDLYFDECMSQHLNSRANFPVVSSGGLIVADAERNRQGGFRRVVIN